MASLDSAERIRRKQVIEDLLKQGYHPQGSKGGLGSATKAAERREGINYPNWARNEEALKQLRRENYAVDWSLYVPPQAESGAVTITPNQDEDDFDLDQGAIWSDYSMEGWVRKEATDYVETADNKRIRMIDPGVQYPYDWTGPLLSDHRPHPARQEDAVTRWIVTGAQDKTPVHGPFMVNLEAFAAHMGADIVIVGSTYNKDWWSSLFGANRDRRSTPAEMRQYSSYIEESIQTDRMKFAGIKVCAEVNISPTAERPLSGLLTYGKGASTIFAHPRQELESVPRAPHLDPVLCWTTGYCTPPNYVQRKAGLKATFHHVIGAVLIEQDVDGAVFVRHIHANPETGTFQDLDVCVDHGEVTTGNRVRSITYGDIHQQHLDEDVEWATWLADDCLQRSLNPEHIFIHDVLDFYSRNHHNRNDPWHAAEVLRDGLTVAQEIKNVANFLVSIRQEGTETHVVESNHDLALAKWVRENDWRSDLLNAPLQLELALAQANAINAGEKISLFETAVKKLADEPLDDIHFLHEDESFLVDGVECGFHGHNGPNGSRGTTQGYLRVACKMNKGHDHTPTKRQGVSSAGTKQVINPMPKYAKGPTSWAQCDVVQYAGGRTAHIIFKNGKWKAMGIKTDVSAVA